MNSTVLKTLALVTLVLAVVLGYVAYRMSAGLGQPAAPAGQAGAEGQPAPVLALVAVKPIEAYQPVPADAVAAVPVAVLPEDYFTRSEEVVGRAPLAAIPLGTTLSQRHFRESNTLVRSIPDGHQAMSLEINDVIAVGGFVRPGDLVDVLLYIRSSGREVEDSQARILLREARVLAYEDRVLNDVETGKDSGGGRPAQRRIRTAVIAVPETDTTRVMLGASLGELRLALRSAEPELPADSADAPGLLGVGDEVPPVQAVTTPADENVITLRELGAIKKRQQPSAAQAAEEPPVVVYRGSSVQRVGQ